MSWGALSCLIDSSHSRWHREGIPRMASPDISCLPTYQVFCIFGMWADDHVNVVRSRPRTWVPYINHQYNTVLVLAVPIYCCLLLCVLFESNRCSHRSTCSTQHYAQHPCWPCLFFMIRESPALRSQSTTREIRRMPSELGTKSRTHVHNVHKPE